MFDVAGDGGARSSSRHRAHAGGGARARRAHGRPVGLDLEGANRRTRSRATRRPHGARRSVAPAPLRRQRRAGELRDQGFVAHAAEAPAQAVDRSSAARAAPRREPYLPPGGRLFRKQSGLQAGVWVLPSGRRSRCIACPSPRLSARASRVSQGDPPLRLPRRETADRGPVTYGQVGRASDAWRSAWTDPASDIA